jgi:peptidyl-prolyl cis-trans isomerase C
MSSYLLSSRILLCPTIILVILCLGCERKTSGNDDSNNPEPSQQTTEVQTNADTTEPNAAVEMAAGAVAVTVNGTDITETELEQAMKPQLDAVAKQAANLPPAFFDQYKKQIRPRILSRLINEKLLTEKIKESDIEITEEEVIAQIEKLISNQPEPLTLEEFKQKVKEHGLNFEDMKDDVRRRLAFEKLMDSLSEGKINVTDEDTRKYYDENPKRFQIPEQIAASHILIKPEEPDPNSADPNEAIAKAKEAALEKAQDLLKQVKDGADFAELAKAHSDCPSAKNGGDLGFFPKGQMVPPFEKAAFELELGQISDIVETDYGYHIIQKTGHKDASVISFDEVKDSVKRQLVQKQQNEFAKNYMESLNAAADIVYPPGKEPPPEANSP